MSSNLDKLYRSFDALKVSIQTHSPDERRKEINGLVKRDKIQHLNLIHEQLVSYHGKQTDDYLRSLTHSIEIFIVFFDDSDKDVCFVAEDCLNKTIKCLLDSNLGRLQVSFYRILRKSNESEKCVRVALHRFAELCHLIRPHKCRSFALYLLKEGVLRKIAARDEESIQSILVQCVSKIASAFCCCLNETEMRQMLDAFIPNLSNQSSINTYRRVAAACLSNICLYSRIPLNSYSILYEELLKSILPYDEKSNKFTILGFLLCSRNILIHLDDLDNRKKLSENIGLFGSQHICEIFEICLHYLDCDDNSIIVASLECIQILLKLKCFKFNEVLCKKGSFSQSFIQNRKLSASQEEIHQTSLSSQASPKLSKNEISGENSNEFESTLNDVFNASVDVDFTISSREHKIKLDEASAYPLTLEIDDFSIKTHREEEEELLEIDKNNEIELQNSECLSQKTQASSQIGILNDDSTSPLVFLTRLLAFKYLLTGQKEGLRSDREIKVLIKSLAFNCITHAIDLQPDIFDLPLFKNENTQNFSDLLLYSNHTDDKIKINAYNLISVLIRSNLKQKLNVCKHIKELLDHLQSEFTSNMCKKSILIAFQLIIKPLLDSKHNLLALEIILGIIPLRNSNYNLVKIELVQLLSSIDYKEIVFLEEIFNEKYGKSYLKRPSIQEQVINQVFMPLLTSDDNKLRQETAKHFVRLCKNLCLFEFKKQIETNDSYLLMLTQSLFVTKSAMSHVYKLNDQNYEINLKLVFTGLRAGEYGTSFVEPFDEYVKQLQNKKTCNQLIEHNVNYLSGLAMKSMLSTSNKYELIGIIEFFDFLFTAFDPFLYLSSDCLIDLINLFTSMLSNTLICFDLYLHNILLRLFGRLSSALIWNYYNNSQLLVDYLTRSYSPKREWCLLFGDDSLIAFGTRVVPHLMKLLCILACVIDESSLPSSLTSHLNSSTSVITGLVDSNDSPEKSTFQGSFQNSSFYMRIYEQTKMAFASYRKSSHIHASQDRFLVFTKSVLNLFAQLLECFISSYEIAKHLDECLLYLKVIFSVDSEMSITCVTQLLKAMFNLNFSCIFFNSCLAIIQQNQSKSISQPHKSSSLTLANLNTLTPFRHQTQQKSQNKTNLFNILVKNSLAQFTSFIYSQNLLFKNENLSSQSTNQLFFKINENEVFMGDFRGLTQTIPSATTSLQSSGKTSSTVSTSGGLINFVKRKISVSSSPSETIVQQQRLDSKLVSQFIRPFESIVIKALRQYTITSNVNLQIKILDLLIQLLNLKINYNSLDGDKSFIDFILRQFEYFEEKRCSQGCLIEKSQMKIDYHNTDDIDYKVNQVLKGVYDGKINEHHRYHTIIPKLFEFLIQISYEKLSGRSPSQIVSLSKLIQISTNLLASENSPHTHVIPALRQLVNELFLHKASIKDFELERDILLQTLLHLVDYPLVWPMLTLAAFKYKQEGNDDKWKKISRQICDCLFDSIRQEKLRFNEFDGCQENIARNESNLFNPYLESVKALIQLLNYLSPQVYRPIDFILIALLDLVNKQNTTNDIDSWLSYTMVLINLVIVNATEDIILARLQDLIPKLLNDSRIIDDYDLLSPAIYLSKYLIKPLLVSFNHLNSKKTYQMTTNLLFYLIYIVQSGYFKKLSNSFKLILSQDDMRESLSGLNCLIFNEKSEEMPLLCINWQYFLLLNEYQVNNENKIATLNGHLIKYSSLILNCDYLNQLNDNTIELSHLLVNNLIDLLMTANETAILSLISVIHRNSSASLLLIQSIRTNWTRILNTHKLHLIKTTLKILEGVHLSCSGQLTWLLIEKFFCLPYLSLVRYADYIACSRVEMIISLTRQEASLQVKENLVEIMLGYFDERLKHAKRHQRLINLLGQLQQKIQHESSDSSENECDTRGEKVSIKSSATMDHFMLYVDSQKQIELNKEWFYNLVRNMCCSHTFKPKQCALLLAHLDYSNLMSILANKDFDLTILSECLLIGSEISHKSCVHHLWSSSKKCLFEYISDFMLKIPNQSTPLYESKLLEMSQETATTLKIHYFVKSINIYLQKIDKFEWLNDDNVEFIKQAQDLVDFLCFQLNFMASKRNLMPVGYLKDSFDAILNLLSSDILVDNLKNRSNYVLMLSNMVKNMFFLIRNYFFTNESEKLIQIKVIESPNDLFKYFLKLKYMIYHENVPFLVRNQLEKVYIGICRMPLIDRFARVPIECLRNDISFDYFLKNDIPTIPHSQDLHDPLILKTYLDNILSIGWTNRTKFEYEYVNMLTLLNDLLKFDQDEVPVEEKKEREKCFCLIIQALSTWLINATLTPFSGNMISSSYEFVSRNKAPLVLLKSDYINLKRIVMDDSRCSYGTVNYFELNIERFMLNDLPLDVKSHFSFNQLSLEAITKFLGVTSNTLLAQRTSNIPQTVANKAINSLLKVAEFFVDDLDSNLLPLPKHEQEPQSSDNLLTSERSFIKNNLDLPSVLRSVLDTYESFSSMSSSTQLKHDLIKSNIYLAQSVFDSKSQYEHLAKKIDENFEFLHEMDDSNENECDHLVDNSLIALGIYTQCFLKSFLAANQLIQVKDLEKLLKISENLLKNSSLAVKIATLNGIFYLLELINDGYLVNNEGFSKQLIDLICKQIVTLKDFTTYATTNARFISILWSLVTYTCENCLHLIRDAQSFINLYLKLTCDILMDSNTSFWLFNQLILCLERLILANIIPSSELVLLNKLKCAKFADDSRVIRIQLMQLCIIYANYDAYHTLEGENPNLLHILELVNSFFDKMKSTQCIRESYMYARMLPQILCDFLPAHDLLNKLITEFSNSSQHAYPESIAYVLNKCFSMLINAKQMRPQVQEWCILSLSNFIQRSNLYESMWLLSCLLTSVTSNQWLQATFSLVLNRYGLCETIDKTIFFMSVVEFMNELKEDANQRESILKAFKSMAKPSNIFHELLQIIDLLY